MAGWTSRRREDSEMKSSNVDQEAASNSLNLAVRPGVCGILEGLRSFNLNANIRHRTGGLERGDPHNTAGTWLTS